MSSTDVTQEHYARPQVKEVILRYCMNGTGSRALNADEHWYKGGKDPKTVMLRGPADYDATIERGRTLYATLDIMEQAVFEQSSRWNKERKEPEITLGDLSNCIAFSLSTDIDGIGDIRKSIAVKEAVEAAARFHCDYLRERGIEKSVYCLYSGGGIYVHLHHGLFAVAVGNTALTPEDRKKEFQVITKAYNRIIGDISQAFFREYPQYIGKVKFDQLNNQKRTFKCIFSIHKRHPFAVIPLDPKAIKIDFSRASLPLSDEVLAEGAKWYQTFDPSEKEPLVGLIRAHMEDVRKDTREHAAGSGTISRLPEPLEQANFAPCIKNIIEKAQPIEGRHRALGILGTYLYQAGWNEDAAFDLWLNVANRCGVEPRIFETTFGRISCPLCSTMQTDTGGYPNLNLFNMGFCVPDEICKGCQWPGDYHLQKILNEEPKAPTLEEALLFIAGRCDGASSIDGQGFNKNDAVFGKAMAAKVQSGKALNPDEYKHIYKMLGKYNTQLVEGEMDIRLIPKEQPVVEEEESNAPEVPPFDPDILNEASKILDDGKGFEYAYQVWQKRHHGDANLGKGLFLSIGAQSCISSKGVHIHACGPRGSGKSDGAEKASEAIPGSHLLVGSASPKALYYLGERLPAGAVVYLDDIGWNDQAAQMFKTCTTFYKDGATHTVVVDQEIMQFKTAPRIIFWLTTADDQTDEQIRDRLLRIDTTETAKHTSEVIDFIFRQRKSGTASFDTRELEVCRAIIYLLKQVFVDVVIPFTDNIRFEGDPRGATIFADLVSSFAIWRHRIRAHDNNGDVIASYEDYKDAETFFNAIRGHGDTKYTPGELRVLQAIKDLHGEATREMLMEKTGISKGGLADIFNGRSRDGQAKYGLLHKCPALTEEDESTQKRIDEDTRQTKRRKVYRLPEDYDILAAYGKAVYLDDENTIKERCSSSSQ